MAKRKKKIENEDFVDESLKLKNVIIVVVAVLLFLGVFYLITVNATKEDDNTDEDADTTYIQTEDILVGSSFNRAGKEYIVVYYDKSNSSLSDISSKVYDYRNKEDRLPLYVADMSNVFNKNYSTDGDTNKSPKDIDELMINGPTLIKFSNDQVSDYIEGIDNILNYLA